MKAQVKCVNVRPIALGNIGLPKIRRNFIYLKKDGVVNDYNRFRMEKLNGNYDQGVLLLPYEIIEELNLEGWSVAIGDLGENITTIGINEENLKIGKIYKIGGAVLELTKPATPCSKLESLCYVGKEKKNEFIKTLVGRRGWYARVLQNGGIVPGDYIIIK